MEEFISSVEFVLSSTLFIFDKVIYKQTYSTLMGSPLSPIIVDIVMQDLEKEILNSLDLNLSFYYRYVDIIILAAPKNKIINLHF